ncbi:DUF7389 domain-containing protein [Natronococcus roseus]|uniref:DUF7389 domain-containing protein n=1 Tax=Natronococcus roseus TaxID=1052014 RepID=UPI00374D9939
MDQLTDAERKIAEIEMGDEIVFGDRKQALEVQSISVETYRYNDTDFGLGFRLTVEGSRGGVYRLSADRHGRTVSVERVEEKILNEREYHSRGTVEAASIEIVDKGEGDDLPTEAEDLLEYEPGDEITFEADGIDRRTETIRRTERSGHTVKVSTTGPARGDHHTDTYVLEARPESITRDDVLRFTLIEGGLDGDVIRYTDDLSFGEEIETDGGLECVMGGCPEKATHDVETETAGDRVVDMELCEGCLRREHQYGNVISETRLEADSGREIMADGGVDPEALFLDGGHLADYETLADLEEGDVVIVDGDAFEVDYLGEAEFIDPDHGRNAHRSARLYDRNDAGGRIEVGKVNIDDDREVASMFVRNRFGNATEFDRVEVRTAGEVLECVEATDMYDREEEIVTDGGAERKPCGEYHPLPCGLDRECPYTGQGGLPDRSDDDSDDDPEEAALIADGGRPEDYDPSEYDPDDFTPSEPSRPIPDGGERLEEGLDATAEFSYDGRTATFSGTIETITDDGVRIRNDRGSTLTAEPQHVHTGRRIVTDGGREYPFPAEELDGRPVEGHELITENADGESVVVSTHDTTRVDEVAPDHDVAAEALAVAGPEESTDRRHTVSESADKITLKTKVKRGSGTRDQDTIEAKVKGNDPDETVRKLNRVVRNLEETAQQARGLGNGGGGE